MLSEQETLDRIGQSPYRVFQHRKGYRFSVDPILLAAFAQVQPGERALDLGTGSAVVPLLLKWHQAECEITGLEIQTEMIDRARRSLALNEVGGIRLIAGDLRDHRNLLAEGAFDLVTANPPFRHPSQGRPALGSERNRARFEWAGGVDDFAVAAAWALRPGGRFCVVFLAERLPELCESMKRRGVPPSRCREVRPYAGRPGRLVLVEGRKGGGPSLRQEEPLAMYRNTEIEGRSGRGQYTQALVEVYRGGPL